MNDAIAQMLINPGFYRISDEVAFRYGRYAVAEVLPNHDCHQLDPKGERDGLLGKDGWKDNAIVFGPFANHEAAVL